MEVNLIGGNHQQRNAAQSVNAPEHFHKAFTPEEMIALFQKHGLTEVKAELRGKLPLVWDKGEAPPCLLAWGRKPANAEETSFSA